VAAAAAWSRDGRRVAYVANGALVVQNADGSGRRALVRRGVLRAAPAWAPDGRSLAFARGGRVEIVRAGKTRVIARGFFSAAWSPDGDVIALQALDGVYLVDPDGRNRRRLATVDTPYAGLDWSPDGSRLAIAERSRILVVDRKGATRTSIPVPLLVTSAPSWSPDGASIAYAAEGDVYAVPAAGGAPKPLAANATEPAWRPASTTRAGTGRPCVRAR
jgi:Tol biopolymer transport system component